jgi:hypothetical protein
LLEKDQATKANNMPAAGKAAATSLPAKEQDATPSTGPKGPRRKPRKLNREPVAEQTPTTTSKPNTAAITAPPKASPNELEALKSRVRGLESKVEELYLVAESRGGRSPRRRGKGRKGSSSTQVPTLSTTAEPVRADDDEGEADEELVRLEDELEIARRDLDSFQPRTRPRTKRSVSGDTEYVEEIPRDDIGGTSETAVDRQVTLSGSYRIPLPSSVSMNDVKTIQSGVSAAQNVAKSFLEQRRAAQANRTTTPPTTTSRPKTTRKASANNNMEISKEEGGKSWGEWFGGYSVAISRAVKNIEAEAALESQKAGAARPNQGNTGKKAAANTSGVAKRPKARQNLSTEQVQGLMS